MCVSVNVHDGWSAVAYADADCTPLKPLSSWVPPSCHRAAVTGILSRCLYVSLRKSSGVFSFRKAVRVLIVLAGYPPTQVARLAFRWAATLRPQFMCSDKRAGSCRRESCTWRFVFAFVFFESFFANHPLPVPSLVLCACDVLAACCLQRRHMW